MIRRSDKQVFLISDVEVSQSDAETPLACISNLYCSIIGKVAIISGWLPLTADGTSGKQIIIKLPKHIKVKILESYPLRQHVGTGRWNNAGSWSRIFSVNLLNDNDERGWRLTLILYNNFRYAGIYPTDALASGDHIALSLILPLE